METNRIMTAHEIAQYIKMYERRTRGALDQYAKLAKSEVTDFPPRHLVAIDHQIQKQLIESDRNDLDLIINTQEKPLPLSRMISESLIDLDIKAQNKKQVLSKLARIAFENRVTSSYESLYIELENREKQMSTGIGNGAALPHARFPQRILFAEPKVILAKSIPGVDFDAPDKKKVHLFFLLCSPDECSHVRLLALVCKLLRFPYVIERFKNTVNRQDIMKIINSFEQLQVLPNADLGRQQ
ncbi:MAG: PTS sugar transporter subunit IIA [Candidatus Omnitrophota bacterium]